MTIMKESVATENGGPGQDKEHSVTTYFFQSEETKGAGAGAGHSGTNGKATEQTIPQNKVKIIPIRLNLSVVHFQVTNNHTVSDSNHPIVAANSTTGDDVRRGSAALIR